MLDVVNTFLQRKPGNTLGLVKHHIPSFVTQLAKNMPAMQETWVQFLVWEDPLEKGKATHSYSGLENSVDCIVRGVAKSQTRLSNFPFPFLSDGFIICLQSS